MSQTKLVNRNLTSTINECLKEHEIQLTTEKGIVPMYLIEVTAPSSLCSDFVHTYNGEVDEFKHRLAKQVLGDNPSPQTYGVLVDREMKYDFAFNRKFADLNSEKNRLVFKTVEELLLENSSGQDLSVVPQEVFSAPPLSPFLSPPYTDPGSTVMRYSLTGKKSGKSNTSIPLPIDFGKASLLDRVHQEYSKNTLELDTNKFFLVNITYQTNTLADFQRTYNGEFDEFKLRLAKQAFGDKKRDNQYALLFDDSLQLQFAYNTLFANYDPKDKMVNYKPVEEVLLSQLQGKDLSKPSAPKPSVQPRRPSRGGTVMRYSLVG